MRSRELSDDIFEANEATPPEVAALLEKFEVGECWEKIFRVAGHSNVTVAMTRYVEALILAGLDIGKGNAPFGYRMPKSGKGKSARILQIFRRN